MISSAYVDQAFVRNLYSDQNRIRMRGEFLKRNSNRLFSVRDVVRCLTDNLIRETVLDYGCGDGSFIRGLLERKEAKRGFALDVVKHHSFNDVMEGLTFLDPSPGLGEFNEDIDVIFCMNVLYHLNVNDIFPLIRSMIRAIRPGGNLIITTKSGDNFPQFRNLVDSLGLPYPSQPDEINFTSENGEEIVKSALNGYDLNILKYDIQTQILTKDYGSVVSYFVSCNRFAHLAPFLSEIVEKMREKPLFVDEYKETIIHVGSK